jgi:hypothetical protein
MQIKEEQLQSIGQKKAPLLMINMVLVQRLFFSPRFIAVKRYSMASMASWGMAASKSLHRCVCAVAVASCPLVEVPYGSNFLHRRSCAIPSAILWHFFSDLLASQLLRLTTIEAQACFTFFVGVGRMAISDCTVTS